MRQLYLLSFSILFFIVSCKTASKAYEQGNYDDAIELAIKKLQKNPGDAEAKALIQRAYTYAVNQHEDQIRLLNNSTVDNRWEQIYRHYNQLQDLYQTVTRYPSAATLVNATDYSGYVQTYRDKVAEVHYEKGIALMKEGEKHAYRQAYQEFKTALKYKPDEYDIKRKMEEAYDLGLIKIVVVPMDNYDRYYYGNGSYQMRRFQDNIVRNLNYGSSNNYVKFFSASDTRSQSTVPDEILEMRFGNITIGRPVEEHRTRKVSKEVVVKETVYSKDSVVKQYATVHARLTTTRRTLLSNADLLITSRDPEGHIVRSDIVRGEHHWQTEFTTYTGDERALSSSDKALLNHSTENIPREDEVFGELLRQIEVRLADKVRYYYSGY